MPQIINIRPFLEKLNDKQYQNYDHHEKEKDVNKFFPFHPIFEGLDNYMVNKNGSIKNVKSGKILSNAIKRTFISNDKKKVGMETYIVVACTFIKNIDPKRLKYIKHSDSDKSNNSVDNITWVHLYNLDEERSTLKNLKTVKNLGVEVNGYPLFEYKNINDEIFYLINPSLKLSRYAISAKGSILNIKNNKCLKVSTNPLKYCSNKLKVDDRKKSRGFMIHRIVAFTLIENDEPDSKIHINHKNKNRCDNNVENLEWCTPKENNKHKSKDCKIKLSGKRVCQIDMETNETIKIWDKISDFGEFHNVRVSNIVQCCKGKRNNAWGFKWRYYFEEIEGEKWYWHNHYGIYVSDKGRVETKSGNVTYGSTALTGYKMVGIGRKNYYIHVLVAEIYVKNDDPTNKLIVNHKDSNRSNNNIENLEWCTHKENNVHAVKFGGLRKICRPVYKLSPAGKILARYPSMEEAGRQINRNPRSIKAACESNTRKCGGHRWKFV
jgi:hypothetical protein